MNHIYIVSEEVDYGCFSVRKGFSTLEKAIEFSKDSFKKNQEDILIERVPIDLNDKGMLSFPCLTCKSVVKDWERRCLDHEHENDRIAEQEKQERIFQLEKELAALKNS